MRIALLVMLGLALSPGRLAAQDVYARAIGGPALVHAAQDVGSDEAVTATGPAYALGLALGGMLSAELALNLDLLFSRANAAEHDLLGETAVTGLFAGGGVTYLIEPAGIFLGGALGVSRSSVRSAPVRIAIEIPQSDSSELGFGLHAIAGKTWPLGDRLGAGAALSLFFSTASNPVSGVDTQRQLVSVLAALAISLK